MSLTIYLDINLYDKHGRFIQTENVFCENITHNLNKMAREADLYQVMWCPEELDIEVASDAVTPLISGIQKLVHYQNEMEKLNPENGWGNFDNLLNVATNYLNAALRYPESNVTACR